MSEERRGGAVAIALDALGQRVDEQDRGVDVQQLPGSRPIPSWSSSRSLEIVGVHRNAFGRFLAGAVQKAGYGLVAEKLAEVLEIHGRIFADSWNAVNADRQPRGAL